LFRVRKLVAKEFTDNMLRKLRRRSGELFAKDRKVGRHATIVAKPLSSTVQYTMIDPIMSGSEDKKPENTSLEISTIITILIAEATIVRAPSERTIITASRR